MSRSWTSICWCSSRARPSSAGRWSTGSAAASRPGSSTPVTTCRPTCWTPPTGCCRSSSRAAPEDKQRYVVPGRQRADRLHRPPGRDGGVERHPRLEGDAQLVDADRTRASPQAGVHHGLSRPGAPRGDGAGHHEGALRVPRHHRRSPTALPAGDRGGHRLPRDVLRRHGARRPDADPRHPLPTDVTPADAAASPGFGGDRPVRHGGVSRRFAGRIECTSGRGRTGTST